MNSVKKSNPAALLPIGVFLVLYLGLGLIFEYALRKKYKENYDNYMKQRYR